MGATQSASAQVAPDTHKTPKPRAHRDNERRMRDVQGRLRELEGRTTFDLKCPNAKKHWEALAKFLDVPAASFNHRHDLCFCSTCMPTGGKNRLSTGGRPQGYTRFALNIKETICETRKVFTDWRKAYHGTTLSATESIINVGKLLKSGSVLPDGKVIGVRDGHIPVTFAAQPANAALAEHFRAMRTTAADSGSGSESEDPDHHLAIDPRSTIFFSPSIKYASHPAYAEPIFLDANTCMVIVLECRVMPGSFVVSGSTLPPSQNVQDDYVQQSAMEWSSEYNGGHFITGVLVKVFKTNAVPGSVVLPPRFDLASAPATTIPDVVPRGPVRGDQDALKLLTVLEGSSPFELDCAYAKACWGILNRLVPTQRIDLRFFNHAYTRCFCPTCIKDKDKTTCYKRGGKPYRVPAGWVRLGLNIPESHAIAKEVWDKWPVCYHGINVNCARPIIEGGELLPPGEVNVQGHRIDTRDTPDDPRDGRAPAAPFFVAPAPGPAGSQQRVYVSPALEYASAPQYAQRFIWKGGNGKKLVAVLQARIRPGSYDVGPSTLVDTPSNPDYSSDEMEWSTERRGVIQIYGLLLKMEGFVHPAS